MSTFVGVLGVLAFLAVIIFIAAFAIEDHKREQERQKKIATPLNTPPASSVNEPVPGNIQLDGSTNSHEQSNNSRQVTRDILLEHVAQERANLEARGATAEELNFVDQFAARLSARLDQKR